MAVEAAPIDDIYDLNPAWPQGGEGKRDGDNHIRNIKTCLRLIASGVFGASGWDTKALSGQAISSEKSAITVTPEGNELSGTLRIILGGIRHDGAIVALRNPNADRPVTVASANSGTQDGIQLKGDRSFILNNEGRLLILFYLKSARVWRELSRHYETAGDSGSRMIGANANDEILDRALGDARWARLGAVNVFTENGKIAFAGTVQWSVERTTGGSPSKAFLRATSGLTSVGSEDANDFTLHSNNTERWRLTSGGSLHAFGQTAKGLGTINAVEVHEANLRLLEKAVSSELTITGAAQYKFSHGLSGVPRVIKPVLVCKTTEHGWAVGDEVGLVTIDSNNDASSNVPWASATEAGVNVMAAIKIPTKTAGTGGTITVGNWRIKIYAWR